MLARKNETYQMTIEAVSFEKDYPWTLIHNGVPVTILMNDPAFVDSVHSGRARFGAGDSLVFELGEELLPYKDLQLPFISKVHDHRSSRESKRNPPA